MTAKFEYLARVTAKVAAHAQGSPDTVCAWCPPNGRRAAVIQAGTNPALPRSHGMCRGCVKDEEAKGGW